MLPTNFQKTEDAGQHFQHMFNVGFVIRRIRTSSDLVVCSLSDLIAEYIKETGDSPDTLLVNPNGLSEAFSTALQVRYKLRVVAVPYFARDSWAIVGNKAVFWSPGA